MITPDDPAGGDDAAWAPRGDAPAAADDAGSGPDVASRSGAARPHHDLVDGYHDFTLVARGGDSVVYRARQRDLDREVAVKVVLLDDPDTKARFRRELAITVRLGRQHPHIVTVLATGTTRDGQPCLVMDFFELGSLQDRLAERGPLPVSEVVAAGAVVADALSFAHGQGVLHRDVKPQNVLVLPTSYVLADFGLARAIDAGHSASLERFSYRHASPQVLDGEAPTTADDIYSLGSTLFTLLAGRPPFAADDPDEDSALSYLRRARTDQPRVLDREGIPPELAAVVARCLAKQPADRFATAADLRAALEAVPTESRSWAPDASAAARAAAPTTAPPTTGPPTTGRPTTAPPTAGSPATPPPSAESPSAQPTPPTAVSPFAPPVTDAAPAVRLRLDPAPVADPAPVTKAAPVTDPAPGTDPAPVADAAPVAVSALAQLDKHGGVPPHPPADGDDATGLRPPEPPASPPPPRPRRWPVLAAAGVVALGFGVVIGLRNGGSGSSADPGRTTATSPSASSSPSPSATTATAASTSASVAVPVPTVELTSGSSTFVVDQSIAPRLTAIKRQNDRITITFTDRSKGAATFVMSAPDGTDAYQGAPGSTGITAADQPTGRRCFYVTAYAPNTPGATAAFRVGKSGPICTSA